MKTHAFVLLATVAFGLPACTGEMEDVASDDILEEQDSAATPDDNGTNGLDTDFIKGPNRVALLGNYNYRESLINNGLNSLSSGIKNLILNEQQNDPQFQGKRGNIQVLKAIVHCALSKGQKVDIGLDDLVEGHVGVHKNWFGNACGSACKQKVSACVISVTNFAAQPIKIDIASDAPIIAKNPNVANYVREGGYWGNIFQGVADVRGCYDSAGLGWENDDSGAKNGVQVQTALLGRTCAGFYSNSKECFITKGVYENYIPYFTNLNSNQRVRDCSSTCDVSKTTGNYINCPAESGGETDYVFTVRRPKATLIKKQP